MDRAAQREIWSHHAFTKAGALAPRAGPAFTISESGECCRSSLLHSSECLCYLRSCSAVALVLEASQKLQDSRDA